MAREEEGRGAGNRKDRRKRRDKGEGGAYKRRSYSRHLGYQDLWVIQRRGEEVTWPHVTRSIYAKQPASCIT